MASSFHPALRSSTTSPLRHLRQFFRQLPRKSQKRLFCFGQGRRFKIIQNAVHQFFTAQHLRSNGGMRPPTEFAFVVPRCVGCNQLTQSTTDWCGRPHQTLGEARQMTSGRNAKRFHICQYSRPAAFVTFSKSAYGLGCGFASTSGR